MPKTKRDLLSAVADSLGGEHAAALRAALKRKTAIDDILDRPMSDEDYEAQFQAMARDLPKLFACSEPLPSA